MEIKGITLVNKVHQLSGIGTAKNSKLVIDNLEIEIIQYFRMVNFVLHE